MNAAPSLTQIVEALLFASPEPLTTAAIVRAIRTGAAQARREAAGEETEETETSTDQETDSTRVDPATAEKDFELDPEVDEPEETADGASQTPASAFFKVTEADVASALAQLVATYQAEGRAFALDDRVSGWRIFTRPEYGVWVRGLFPDRKAPRLSQPALETLAIIAYRQPITKAAIEAVRGVTVDGPLQRLLDQNLVRIVGRADLPGRPLLYETTDLFFEHFGIKSIDDLPNAAELRRVALPQPESEKPAEAPAPASDQSDPSDPSDPSDQSDQPDQSDRPERSATQGAPLP